MRYGEILKKNSGKILEQAGRLSRYLEAKPRRQKMNTARNLSQSKNFSGGNIEIQKVRN